jgi:Zn-finger nucleic acid-binding protein
MHHGGDLFDIAIQKAVLVERANQIIGDRVVACGQADVQIALNRLMQRCRCGDGQQRVEIVLCRRCGGVITLGLGQLEVFVEAVDTCGAAQRPATEASARGRGICRLDSGGIGFHRGDDRKRQHGVFGPAG